MFPSSVGVPVSVSPAALEKIKSEAEGVGAAQSTIHEARSQVTQTWGNIADQPEAKAELATHAERMAQLNRILDVAQDKGDTALAAKTNAVIQREIARDTRVLQGIRAKEAVR